MKSAGSAPGELHVVVDQLLAPVPGGIGRYTFELTRALLHSAPEGSRVTGVVSAATPRQRRALLGDLPLAALRTAGVDRRWVAAAWQRGWTAGAPSGSVHATSLLAPLTRRGPHPVVMTIHDAVPWTHPETLTSRGVRWHRDMAARAERYADAIVVPTHAVADELTHYLDLGDRVHVIGGAPSASVAVSSGATERARVLRLPERYVLGVGTVEPRKEIGSLIAAMRHLPHDLTLVLVGARGWGGVDVAASIARHGLDEDRIRLMGQLTDADLAATFASASVYVMPSRAEGFGLPLLEAFAAGVPVVHSDVPALVEVAGGAGLIVPRDGPGYDVRIAEAIEAVLSRHELADDLVARGRLRRLDFSWERSAAMVWELHRALGR